MRICISIFSILLFNLNFLSGQGSGNKFSIGIDLHPKILYRSAWIEKAVLEQGDAILTLYYKELLDAEKPVFGWGIGIPVSWYKDSLVSFETGVEYSQRGFGWFADRFVYRPSSNGKSILHFIDIPLRMRRILYHGSSVKFYVKAGAHVSFLVKLTEIRELSYSDRTVDSEKEIYNFDYLKDHEYRRANLTGAVALGAVIPFSNKLEFKIEPISTFLINPVPKRADIKRRFWEIGIRTGAVLKL